MNILLIEDRTEEKQSIILMLKERFPDEIVLASSIQDGIEISENQETPLKIIVCDYHGLSTALIRCLLSVRPNVPYVLITNNPAPLELLTKKRSMTNVEIVTRANIRNDFPKALEKLNSRSGLKLIKIQDSEFIKMSLDSFRLLKPLNSDIYIRIGEHKYIKIFKKDDQFEEADLSKFLEKTHDKFFYLKAEDSKAILEKQNENVATYLKNKQDQEVVKKVVITQLAFIQEVIIKIGVTPPVQELAKQTVLLTLKILGNSPKLSAIVKRLKQENQRYISGHSIVLAQIACALACKMDWHSQATFIKLSLAAFLHGLSLDNDDLAQVQAFTGLEIRRDLSLLQIHAIKFHPMQAADYAKQFREIPPDVDTIILEHHERPDGSGFPRGLHFQQITPLSSLFIIAHDILNFFLLERKDGNMKEFLASREKLFSHGMFKKIFQAIQRDYLKNK